MKHLNKNAINFIIVYIVTGVEVFSLSPVSGRSSAMLSANINNHFITKTRVDFILIHFPLRK